MRKPDKRQPDSAQVLDATSTIALRGEVSRLRLTGLSRNAAASEMLRAKIYNWAESQADDGALPRLRLVKD